MPDIVMPASEYFYPSAENLLIRTGASLLVGLVIAGIYMFRSKFNRSFVVTLALLPAIVQIIVMVVNGNLGAGVAMAGTFNLVRFRSIPGNAKDLGSIFLAMALGLLTGMGYIEFAFIFLGVIGAANLILTHVSFGRGAKNRRTLRVVIPENIDYENLFDDIFDKYEVKAEVLRIRTINLGSLFEITYDVRMKKAVAPKAFIDEMRCRNGNLAITVSGEDPGKDEL